MIILRLYRFHRRSGSTVVRSFINAFQTARRWS
jgi:hypothetical protein